MLVKQTASISQSPISVQIGGTFNVQPPTIFLVPGYNIQEEGVVVASGIGKWVSAFNFFDTSAVGATTFSFSDVEGCYGSFLASVPSSITTLDAPKLTFVGSSLLSAAPVTLASLTSISLPSLYYIPTIFSNTTLSGLTSLDLSSLVYCPTIFSITANSLTTLSLPKLKYANTFTVSSTGCTSISLASLVWCAGTITITAASCTTLTLPSLGTWKVFSGGFTATTSAFNQTTVDNILAALAYMDGTNNTLAYSTGRTVSITGTSSAPSNAGSTTTAGSNFVGTTTTCTVNITAHGYATDDVLRISGITTLTNANRYARITVVNANQFTYTITSQTATGAGTATIVKANASAKALVTRGVTLTTN